MSSLVPLVSDKSRNEVQSLVVILPLRMLKCLTETTVLEVSYSLPHCCLLWLGRCSTAAAAPHQEAKYPPFCVPDEENVAYETQ